MTQKNSILSNKQYEIIKWFILIFLPAVGVFYTTVAGVFDFPFAGEVNQFLVALALFLGTITKISDTQYQNLKSIRDQDKIGYIVGIPDITDDNTNVHVNFNLPEDLSKYAKDGVATFKLIDPKA